MAVELNTAHRNAVAAAIGAIFNSGHFLTYTGSRPGANESATGTELFDLDLPSSAFGSPNTGAVAGNWQGTVATTGAPGYSRLTNTDGSQIRELDAAESPGSGESVIFDGLVDGDLVEGGTVTVAYTLTQPGGDSVA